MAQLKKKQKSSHYNQSKYLKSNTSKKKNVSHAEINNFKGNLKTKHKKDKAIMQKEMNNFMQDYIRSNNMNMKSITEFRGNHNFSKKHKKKYIKQIENFSGNTKLYPKYDYKEAFSFSGENKKINYKDYRKQFQKFNPKYIPYNNSDIGKIANNFVLKIRKSNRISLNLFLSFLKKKEKKKNLDKFAGEEKIIKNLFSRKKRRKMPKMKHDPRESEIWYSTR